MTLPRTLTAAALVALLAGCGDSTGSAAKGPDASARAACEHFRNVADDVADGILTPSELREKVKDIYDAAQVTKEPGMAPAGRRLLAAATSGGTDELLSGFRRFDMECDEAGL